MDALDNVDLKGAPISGQVVLHVGEDGLTAVVRIALDEVAQVVAFQ